MPLALSIASVLAALAAPPLPENTAHLLRYADVHGDLVVFTYEDDLWLASVDGGEARRITRHPGTERFAKFSPDGRQLAFTAEYDGNKDVYVMDTRGSTPRRLTYHPAEDRVLDWFPDGQSILIRSNREYPQRGDELYRVSLAGGMPVRMPVDRAGLASLSPDGTRIAYNRISREERTWKRHKGGTADDIWLGDLRTGQFDTLTDWAGTDSFPMWWGEAIYFTSDRHHGTLNLFRLDPATGETAALTDNDDYDIKYPSMGDGRIVFQYAETLHLLDLASGEVRPLAIQVPTDRVRMRARLETVTPQTGTFRLSPSGKRLLVECRGEIMSLPAKEGTPRNLTNAVGSREKNAVWSPDGRYIAFYSDRTGEEELYVTTADGAGEWRQLTTDGKGFRLTPVWSPDSKRLLFSDKYLRLNLVDVATGSVIVVDHGEYDDGWERWGIQDYVFSPDSAWIAYTKLEESIYESIFLYNIAEGKIHRVTGPHTNDWSPSFDPQGRYLYFLSNRSYRPVMGFVDQNYVFFDMTRPYLLLLQADAASPFAPQEDDEPETLASTMKKDTPADTETNGVKPVKIDLDGLPNRLLALEGVEPGTYFRLEATASGCLYLSRPKPQFLKYQAVTDQSTDPLDLYEYTLKDKKTQKRISGIANYHLSHDRKKLVYRAGTTYGVVDVGADAKVGDGAVSFERVRVLVDRAQEFMQIFNEAWRIERDWFYDPNMHGIDWALVGEMYRRFVPHCGTRADLNYLIGEMIGELDAGHTYVGGGDLERPVESIPIGLLGADFAADEGSEYFRIAHIIPGVPGDPDQRSPFTEPGCGVREGHYLIAIEGRPVTTRDNIYAFLQAAADSVVTITYNDRPTEEGAKRCKVRTLSSEWAIRYREWVERNRAYVEKASGGRLGYVHLPNMMEAGIIEFERDFFPQYYKDGFIVDERYNGGGFTSDMLIDRLERKIWNYVKPREGRPQPNPERAFGGPLVVLVNEDTGSSGEWFAEAIKRRGLAPLLGMRTWGGSIGIEPHQPLVDGGSVTAPQFAPYGLDGTWPIEGHGVDPDIVVPNPPADVLAGRDPQLEAAVQYLLEQLQANPPLRPEPPPYPVKRKPPRAGR